MLEISNYSFATRAGVSRDCSGWAHIEEISHRHTPHTTHPPTFPVSSTHPPNNTQTQSYHQRGPSDCPLCSILPRLVFGCTNADFCDKKAPFLSVFRALHSFPYIVPESCHLSNCCICFRQNSSQFRPVSRKDADFENFIKFPKFKD